MAYACLEYAKPIDLFDVDPLMSECTFGTLPNGLDVTLVKLSNRRGMQVDLLNYGASIHRIKTPDINGVLSDVTLFCTSLDDHLKQRAFLGATIGRYANRINKASFTLEQRVISLAPNEGSNQLHGGPHGFDKKLWRYSYGKNDHAAWARFTLTSPDGDQGFPGELSVTAEYRLDNQNKLTLTYTAHSNKPTVISMTNHSYFNLSGKTFSNLDAHYIQITAKQVLETNSEGIPTGNLQPCNNTHLDLSQPTEISRGLSPIADELLTTRGYDHNYVFPETTETALKARIFHADSGRVLSISSNHSGVQFYTGNFLQDCSVTGPGGTPYRNHSGFCIEPQRFPDAPNHTHFPSSQLNPGDTYHHSIEYQFSTINIDDTGSL